LGALRLLGEENFAKTLTSLGLSGFEHANSFGPSLALGSVDVRLLELTNAYRALANGGTWSEFRVSPDKLSELAPRHVFSPGSSFVIGDILADHNGRSVFSSENWAVGFSEKYTVGVWVSREKAAFGVWQEVMDWLHREDPAQPAIPPEGLVRAAVDLGHGRWLGEWFLAGTEPLAGEANTLLSRISYPKNHDTIELDSLHGGLLIKVIAPKSNQTLYINGERIGRAQTYLSWTARSGKHTLELRDSQGQVVDRVRFVVKGASFAQAR
jgi:penicillin-binding protein 1C